MKFVKLTPYNTLKTKLRYSGQIPVSWCGGLPGAEIVCCVFRAKAVKSHEDTWAVRLASPWEHYLFGFKMIFTDWAFRNLFILSKFM